MKIKDIGYQTDPGKVREHNEDYLFVDDKIGLFIVADGMGGHHGGEVASKMAVSTVADLIKESLKGNSESVLVMIEEAFRKTNEIIYTMASKDPELNGMGTTMVVAHCHNNKIYVAHVGDSRAYLIRNGNITQLTKDHSVVAELLNSGEITGEEARNHYLRHIVTKALGYKEAIDFDVMSINCQKGDCFLLCTDGLTDMLTDEQIREIVTQRIQAQKICDDLISNANRKGGQDNITVILFRI